MYVYCGASINPVGVEFRDDGFDEYFFDYFFNYKN
jgi:hypothetical protein